MLNNDVMGRVRYIFDFDDSKMIDIFKLADLEVKRWQVRGWLSKEDAKLFKKCNDITLATFLNGLIIEKRGKRDGPQVKPETRLNNNMIFMKLKIAFSLRSDDILEILNLAGLRLSAPELSSFFRKPGHRQYRDCMDQVLRNFLNGLQLKLRGDTSSE
jgi:uncharacterized protein YehS (DUF1456 family)